MKKDRLRLKKETLADLAPADLAILAGAAPSGGRPCLELIGTGWPVDVEVRTTFCR